MLKKIQDGVENVINPIANWISTNKYVKAMSEGFMSTMAVTIGVALIAILINLPFEAWSNLLNVTGIYTVANDLLSATMSLLGIYVVVCISYRFMKNEGGNEITGIILAVATFLVLMPIQHEAVGEVEMPVYLLSNMGTNGIFVAMLCGLIIPSFFSWLMKKNIRLHLPSAVPPMVSESLSPIFSAIIIFAIDFLVKYGFSLTSYGDIFTFINDIVAKPVMGVGSSPWTLILVYTFMNFMWFFGVHPAPIMGAYAAVMYTVGMANAEAFIAGNPLPYVSWSVVYFCVYHSGTGGTLGLCLATLFAKSTKYKEMRKLIIPANIFNINEPIVFGFPLMLNPIYFIPMVLGTIVAGLAGYGLSVFLPLHLNPTIQMPWITPGFIQTFMNGGLLFLLVWLVALFIYFAMYLPFFLIDDKRCLEEEKKIATE